MAIGFTTPADNQLGYRRLELNTYKDGRIPALFHDTDIIKYGGQIPPIPLAYDHKKQMAIEQTFENVMNLIDSTPIMHIIGIFVRKFHAESEIIYDWSDVAELANAKAFVDSTLSIM